MLSSVDSLEERGRNIILKLLERGPKTSLQLEKALENAEIPSEISQALIERFGEVGLIDDEQFARQVAQAARSNKGLSRLALRRKLVEKGLEAAVIEKVTSEISDEQELETAQALAQKRWGQLTGFDEETAKRRLHGFLLRRGYSASVISSVMRGLQR